MPSSLHRPAISAIASLVVGLGLSACGDDMIVDSATASASESGSASGGLTTSGTSGSTGGTS
ncbi:MAG: hypothetical protein KC420_06165, partial [Myxococcales bacterium]|nr:hypothetical protein [Myxococcales bacterium]